MDVAYLHIITNHIPIIGVPLALFLLGSGVWRKSDELKTAGFLIFALLGVATLATFLLGQGGEEFVEELAGVSERAIEEHEDFARFALAAVAVTSIFALFALGRYKGFSFLRRGGAVENQSAANDAADSAGENALEKEAQPAKTSVFPNRLTFAVLALGLASSALLGYTGKLGGKIRHTEFYGTAAAQTEEDEKKRRTRNEQRPDKKTPLAETDAETQTDEADADREPDEKSGKKRGRNRGGRQ